MSGFGSGFDAAAQGGEADARSQTAETEQTFFTGTTAQAQPGYTSGDKFDGRGPRPQPPYTGMPQGPPSVVGDDVPPGGSNLTGGVVRRARRSLKATAGVSHGVVAKNYRTSNAIMFNNMQEMFQDTVSREYAQEILEELFAQWGVPTHVPEIAKFAEDLVFTFVIASTASNKADYNKEFDIAVKGQPTITVSFTVLSTILDSKYGVTRRQLARGLANDFRRFLKQEENKYLLPILATRIGCDPQFADLAFDGSTHCSGMTSREIAFTKILESRNLFEDEAVLAAGASDRLMNGVSTSRASKVPR